MPSADFLRLNPGYRAADMSGANRRRSKRSAAMLDRPARAKAGEGDRVKDLMTLAAAGYTCTHYDHASKTHWMSGAAGETPRVSSYRQMLDDTLRTL